MPASSGAATRDDSGDRVGVTRASGSGGFGLALVAVVSVVAGAGLAFGAVRLGFGASVVAAVLWCRWLDAHPTEDEETL